MQRGLTLLDQTMLAVVGGELSPIMTGLMYCSVIEACRDVYAIARAREWTAALSRWCEQRSDLIAFTGACHVYRAEIMQFLGAWPDALAEARRACERAQRTERRPPGIAVYRQAEIHRLRGELAQADDAYRYCRELGYEPQPGLALMWLAQGRTEAASAAVKRVLMATTAALPRAQLLPAYVEIMLAIGGIDEARTACHELAALAERCDTDVLRAATAQSRGAIAMAEGRASAAIASLRSAFDLWTRLEAPYDAARVRVLVGRACRILGDLETAALEFAAARSTFDDLGARMDRAKMEAIEAQGASSTAAPLTAREREVLALIAAGHTNKTIAEQLRLSERTIDRHVSNILTKLDVPSRAGSHGLRIRPPHSLTTCEVTLSLLAR